MNVVSVWRPGPNLSRALPDDEDRLLVRLHDELGPELDVGRAFRRHAMHERAVGLVEKVDDFHFPAHDDLAVQSELVSGK